MNPFGELRQGNIDELMRRNFKNNVDDDDDYEKPSKSSKTLITKLTTSSLSFGVCFF